MLIAVVLIFLLLWIACGAVWFVGPVRLRPPWWDWGLDKEKDEAHEKASDVPPE